MPPHPPPVRRVRPIWLGLLFALVLALAFTLGRLALGGRPAETPPLPTPGIEQASVDELLTLRSDGDWQPRWLRDNGAVLVIQFPGLRAQGRALNRTAALIEKGGQRRDHVLSDAELQAALDAAGDNESSYFLGHDYRAEDLGRFYSLAQAQQLPLNAEELRLRRLLLDAGLLRPTAAGGFDGTPDRALISFSAEQADDPATLQDEGMDGRRRASVLRHELSHGRFFTDARYHDHCWAFWRDRLSETEREVWRRYLAQLGYDPGNEELMVNETQALLMHTPDLREFDPAAMGQGGREIEGQRERFRAGMP